MVCKQIHKNRGCCPNNKCAVYHRNICSDSMCGWLGCREGWPGPVQRKFESQIMHLKKLVLFLSWIFVLTLHPRTTWAPTWQAVTVKFANQIMATGSIFAGLEGTFINVHWTVFVWQKRKWNVETINHVGFGIAEKLLHNPSDNYII